MITYNWYEMLAAVTSTVAVCRNAVPDAVASVLHTAIAAVVDPVVASATFLEAECDLNLNIPSSKIAGPHM